MRDQAYVAMQEPSLISPSATDLTLTARCSDVLPPWHKVAYEQQIQHWDISDWLSGIRTKTVAAFKLGLSTISDA